MNVIFLDIDGELTYSNYKNENTANIDISRVLRFKRICDETNAKVVISSSWRGNDSYKRPRIYHVLIDILAENGIEVIGDCPLIPAEVECSVSVGISLTTLENLPFLKTKHGTGRAAEVEKWLLDYKEVSNFLILDDEDYDWKDYEFNEMNFAEHWIQPTWFGNGGIQEEHVDIAIEILKGNYEKEYNR